MPPRVLQNARHPAGADVQTVKCPSLFFIGLVGIDLPNAPAPGITLRHNLKVTTDREFIKRLISQYTDRIGSVEADFLVYTARGVVFSRGMVDIQLDRLADAINGLLVQNLAEIQMWMLSLWTLKDNAVDADVGWMAVNCSGTETLNNNRWSSLVSKAGGTRELTMFSAQELREATSLSLSSGHWNEGAPLPISLSNLVEPVTKLSGTVRFQRFMYFVDSARTSRDVAIKIAHYCTALEAIVSSSQAELSHQVAERVSCLLCRRGEERLATFKFVKEAYGIRSKAVHGAHFKVKEEEQLRLASPKIDDICRKITNKYLSDEPFRMAIESDQTNFNDYWLRRTLVDGVA